MAQIHYKRLLWLLFATLFILFSHSAAIASLPSVTVVTEVSPPAQIIRAGQVEGLLTDRVRQALDMAGVKGRFKVYPWARALNMAQKWPNTLIYGIAKTPERLPQFIWLGELARYELGLVHLSRHPVSIESPDDLAHYSIAVQRDDIAYEYLSDIGLKEQLMLTADINASWKLMLKGKVDLVVDDPNIMHLLGARFGLNPGDIHYAYPLEDLFTTAYLAAHPDTHPEVVSRVRQALKELNRQQPFQW